MKDLKIYGLIPLKSTSTRFPGKNFSKFCNTTLLDNTIKKLYDNVDYIFISTDIPNLIENKHDTKIFIVPRPGEFVTPDSTQDSVVKDFIDQIDRMNNDDYIIILCQVTSPNWSSHRLKYAINKLKQHNKTIISVSENYHPNGCFYIFTKDMFLEHNSIYNHDDGIYLISIPSHESIDIDYEYQLRIAEAIQRGDYAP